MAVPDDSPEPERLVVVPVEGRAEEFGPQQVRQLRRDGTAPGFASFVWPPAYARVIAAVVSRHDQGRGTFTVPRHWPPLWRAWLLRAARRRLPRRSVDLSQQAGHWFVLVSDGAPGPPRRRTGT